MTYRPPPTELLVAQLANPLVDTSDTDILADEVPLAFVTRNKLDAVLAERNPNRFTSLAEQTKRAVVFETLNTLQDQFSAADIEFVVIKSLPIVPKPVGDVDVLVDDFDRTDHLLIDEGFETVHRSQFKAVFEKYVDDTRVALHIHESIGWESIEYVSPEAVLSDRTTRTTPYGTFPVPSPDHEVLITAAHTIFERGNYKIRLLNVIEAAIHSREHDVVPRNLLPVARAFGWERPLRRYLCAVDRVHDAVYGGRIFGDGYQNVSIPATPYNPLFDTWLFPIRTIVRDRVSVITDGRTPLNSNYIYTYTGDLMSVLTERYGLTYSRRRIQRWLTHIQSTIS